MLRSRRRKKLIVQRNRASAAMRPNQIWGLDFVFDTTESGRSLKCLVVLDEYTRYLITARIARSCSSADVIRALEQSTIMHGEPECLKSDNGPEFTSRAMIAWTIQRGIQQCLITPGKPIENSSVESFNGKLRDEFLNENLFLGVRDAQEKLALWRDEYNRYRPHSSLGNHTPEEIWRSFEDGLTQAVV